MKIIGQIFEEDNYDVFRRLPDNRDVLSKRLNKLIASISVKYILNPIVVNEKMEIIDGQGRFEALKSLGMPIAYIISPGATSEDCRRMNKYNTSWSMLDFCKSHAKSGRLAYVLLLKTCKDVELSITKVLRLSNHGGAGRAAVSRTYAMNLFERGDLVFTESDAETVMSVKRMIDEIIDALQYTGRVNDAFLSAVKIISDADGYSHERMLKNCRILRGSYVQMGKVGDQLKEFERIYNHRARTDNRLYFSDYMRTRGANVRDYSVNSTYADNDVSTLREV